jgi:hypothetical protein
VFWGLLSVTCHVVVLLWGLNFSKLQLEVSKR